MTISPPQPRPAASLTPGLVAARLERLPVGGWHRKLTLIVGVGAFYEYFEVFLGSVLAAVLAPAWDLSTFEKASLIGSVFFGMFIGALTLGKLADRVGRRKMFLINLAIYLAFSLLAAFSPNIWFLVACRVAAGIGAGAEAALIPTYLGEFIPRHLRGRYIGYAFAMAFVAYPVVALIGAQVADQHFIFDGWRWLLVAGASGVVLLLWMRRGLPESPRWLVAVGRHEEAEAQLQVIEAQVEASIGRPLPGPEVTEAELADVAPAPRARFRDLFGREAMGGMIAVGALWSIGVLGYYGFSSLGPSVLAEKGFDIQKSLTFTSIMAIGFPLGALVAAWFAERCERRTLTVVTALLCAVAGLFFGYGTSDLVILAAGTAMGFISNIHSSGVNMYASEVFPTRLRSTAIGFCYGIGRIFAMLLPFLGLTVLEAFGGSGVLVMAAICFVLTAILVRAFGPLTTGRVLEDITGESRTA